MSNEKYSVDLSRQELGIIEAALRTQEKILSVQSRADGDGTARARLEELKQVLRNLDRQVTVLPQAECNGWSSVTRSLFG